MMRTYGSLFTGIGGWDLAADRAGMRCLFQVEIDPVCRSVLARHWPDVERFEDVCQVGAHNLPPVDVLVFSAPCFPAGTLILCADGFKPIEAVAVGDQVLTHHNRWRPVVRVGGQYAPTVEARGVGHWGMETTADHPFLALASRSWSTHRAGISVRLHDFGPTEWVAARDLAGKRWASPTVFPACDPPEIPSSSRDVPPPPITVAMCWVLGAWLGDGWTQTNQRSGRPIGDRRGEVFICGPEPQIREIERRVEAAGYTASLTPERTVWRARIHNRALAHWLDDQFGRGAAFKRLPPWVLGLPAPMRQALLDGYLFADGSTYKQGWKATTVSRALAVGIRLLALSLGWQVRSYRTPGRGHTMIEGRRVRERATYQLVGSRQPRAEIVRDGMRFGLVRSVRPTGRVEPVYNLEVDDDNSYIADGMAVHNCQDLSVAGQRVGLQGARSGLYFEAIRIIRELRPALALFEQVPGLLSSHGGRDFGLTLDALADIGALDIGWAVLDARWWRVAQRRRRLYVVADFTHRRASQVLALADGLSGHPAPGREAGQDVAAPLASGAGGGRTYDTDTAKDNLIASPIAATLNSSRPGERGYRNDADTAENLIAYQATGDAFWREGATPLAASDDNGSNHVVATDRGAQVRRLMPVECERLMGLPDGWTDGRADSHRYRMLGNSVAVPVVEWLLRRVVQEVA
jgi:DNA-cytosine methyltransferase